MGYVVYASRAVDEKHRNAFNTLVYSKIRGACTDAVIVPMGCRLGLIENEVPESKSLQKHRVKRLLDSLAAKEGRHTELITLYVPPDRQISEVMNNLREEYGTASNIKSRTTRHNVESAIEKVLQRLRLFKQPPPTGVAIFCGAIPHGPPGSEKLEINVLVPPETINIYLYRCDSKFHLNPLYEMIREKEVFGVMVLDGGGSTFGVLQGKSLNAVKSTSSGIWGKHRAGGQSARRFERLREAQVNEYYKRLAGYASQIFLKIPDMKGIILGGPGPSKHDFLNGDYLHYTLKEKILGVVDTAYVDEQGLKEAVNRAPEILRGVRMMDERRLVQEFMYEIAHDRGLAAYGEEEVRKSLHEGAVKILLLSEKLDKFSVDVKCTNCDYTEKQVMEYNALLKFEVDINAKPCPKCNNQTLTIAEKTDVIDEFTEIAAKTNAQSEIISISHEDGEMLWKSFGGIAAILRYPRK